MDREGSEEPGASRTCFQGGAGDSAALLGVGQGAGEAGSDHKWGAASPWVGWQLLLVPSNGDHEKGHLLRHTRPQVVADRLTPRHTAVIQTSNFTSGQGPRPSKYLPGILVELCGSQFHQKCKPRLKFCEAQ